jgi:hypothetical protein
MHHLILDHDMEYQYEHIQKNLLSNHLTYVLLNQYQKEQLEENLQLTNCLLQPIRFLIKILFFVFKFT